MTDWKALCAELTHEVEQYADDRGDLMPECADRARAALAAEPVTAPAGPTDEEIIAFWSEHCAGDGDAGIIRLSRWGNQPAPPVEGEVGELPPRPPIKGPPEHPWLVRYGVTWQGGRNEPLLTPRHDGYWTPWFVAADLLEQRHPAPVPVAVPEGREPASIVGEPSDKELLELMHRSMRDDLAEVSRLAALQAGTDPGVFRVCLNYDVAKFARAVLARWGHKPAPAAEGEVAELVEFLRIYGDEVMDEYGDVGEHDQLTRAADLLEQLSSGWVVPTVEQFAPVPPAEVTPGPSIEAVGSLIAWLSEQACQAADAGQPTDAGMLTWAAQVIGERVDEDAPAPMAARDVAELALKELEQTVVLLMPVTGHKKIKRLDTIRAALKRLQELENNADLSPAPGPAEGEVAELVAWLRGANWDSKRQTLATRAADLLEQRHPAPVPGGMIPVEYWDMDSGARIVSEPSEEGAGGCWIVLNSRYVNPLTEFPTARAAWDALQQANALPLPAGEVEP